MSAWPGGSATRGLVCGDSLQGLSQQQQKPRDSHPAVGLGLISACSLSS